MSTTNCYKNILIPWSLSEHLMVVYVLTVSFNIYLIFMYYSTYLNINFNVLFSLYKYKI